MSGASPLTEARRKRSKRMFEAGISAVICKGLVLALNAVSVPIAVRYLGAEQFGVWVTISTTLALLIVLDLGIAGAMTNYISEAYALEDRELAGRYAATGLFVMLLIAIGLGAVGAVFWPLVHWGELFRLPDAANDRMISHAVAAAYVVFLVGLPAGLAAKFLGGYQEIKTANIFAAIGAGANLLAVVIITRLHGNLVLLVIGSSGATVGTNLVCLLWLFIWHKPWLMPTFGRYHISLVRPLLRTGMGLFILQLAGLAVFNTDNFIIAHFLGPAEVTPYSITWKLVGYTAALQTIMTPALWPAYAEAWTRGDLRWIRRTLRMVILISMSAAGVGCIILIIWGKTLIRIWAGPAAVPTQTLIVLMCVWVMICTFMANTSTVLAASKMTRLLAWLSVAVAFTNLAASIWLVQRIGSVGVILGTIGSFLLILVIPQTWKVISILRTPFEAAASSTVRHADAPGMPR
jgi:O-antigen/teichoic acid export membrane protein